MKKVLFTIGLVASMAMTSCVGVSSGKSADSETVEAKTLTVPFLSSMPIEGAQSSYFSIPEGSGDVSISGEPDDSKGVIRATVKINVVKEYANVRSFSVFYPLSLCFLNADKEEIERLTMSSADEDIVLAELRKKQPGEIEISYKGEFYPEKYNKIFSEAKYVQIQRAALSDGDSGSNDDDVSGSNSSSSSSDWDNVLNSYEEYVNKYISVMKKAANGDASALAEYPALLEKAQEFDNKISSAKDELTPAQSARFMKITSKMSSAVQ